MNIIIVAKPDAGTRVFSLSDKRVRAAAGIAAGVVVFGLLRWRHGLALRSSGRAICATS